MQNKFQSNESLNILQIPKLNQKLPMDNLFIKMPKMDLISKELRYAIKYFSKYKLFESSKWLSELLISKTDFSCKTKVFMSNYCKNNTDLNYVSGRFSQQPTLSEEKEDALLLIRTLFDLREYKKCAFNAERLYQEGNFENEIVFFYAYSLYVHDKLRREEELVSSTSDDRKINIVEFSNEMEMVEKVLERHDERKELEEVNLFVLALIKKDRQKNKEAIELLVRTLNKMPFFWSAWLELCRLLVEGEDVDCFEVLGRIDNHWMKNFFASSLFIENIRTHENYENYCYDICYGLWIFFDKSCYLLNMLAVLFHNLSNYENSMDFFQKILILDPFRYENIDILSNILYVKEKQNELGRLAINCFENDKYLPETCCVLGNYYSLIGDHPKAALFFQRAIALDRNFLAAYTLLGHEYLEIKNVTSAIEAYNSAVQINKKDFRAWYGLGQAYELQNHFDFALYYFLEALKSNPRDSRMWNAIGNCYERLGKESEATMCLEKAETFKDHEGISLFQLGKMYDLLNYQDKAVQCFEDNLKKKEEKKIFDKEMGETLLYLAIHYKNIHDYDTAMSYASRLLNFNGIEKQEAQNLILEINALEK
jgi:anaphase-promoting complex subunit 8